MNSFIYMFLGFILSTIGDYSIIKQYKTENEELKKTNSVLRGALNGETEVSNIPDKCE